MPPSDGEPKRRFFSLLKRTARSSEPSRRAEDNAIWLVHERAVNATRAVSEASQRLSSSLAKERGAADAASDRARAAVVRAQELGSSFTRVIDVFERLGLVALNAGLEGARLGESVGRSLTIVSDDVRAQATRGGDQARELASMLTEIGSELTQLTTNLDRAREASNDASQDAARASGSSAEIERALTELSERLKKTTGSDPETARAIAEAAEHARALVVSLGTLRGKMPRELLAVAVKPMLDPLVRLLDMDADEASDGGGEGNGSG